jgi:hypothetical protein
MVEGMRMRRWRERAREALREAGADERGLVTAEWAVIAAIALVLAILVVVKVMGSADTLAVAIDGKVGDIVEAMG